MVNLMLLLKPEFCISQMKAKMQKRPNIASTGGFLHLISEVPFREKVLKAI